MLICCMRFLKTLLCVLFLIAASIAPAAALPICKEMTKQASVSNSSDAPHCSGASGDTTTQSVPPSPDATTKSNPPHEGGCCCDGDMGSGCKTHCKTISGAMALIDADTQHPDFVLNFVSGKNSNHTPFIFEIITPPPRSCV